MVKIKRDKQLGLEDLEQYVDKFILLVIKDRTSIGDNLGLSDDIEELVVRVDAEGDLYEAVEGQGAYYLIEDDLGIQFGCIETRLNSKHIELYTMIPILNQEELEEKWMNKDVMVCYDKDECCAEWGIQSNVENGLHRVSSDTEFVYLTDKESYYLSCPGEDLADNLIYVYETQEV